MIVSGYNTAVGEVVAEGKLNDFYNGVCREQII